MDMRTFHYRIRKFVLGTDPVFSIFTLMLLGFTIALAIPFAKFLTLSFLFVLMVYMVTLYVWFKNSYSG